MHIFNMIQRAPFTNPASQKANTGQFLQGTEVQRHQDLFPVFWDAVLRN